MPCGRLTAPARLASSAPNWRIVYDAIRRTAGDPLGTVVPADFLFEEISANLLQSGVLLREVNETIARQDDGSLDGRLKSRLCALVFLIRKLPREAGVDIGVRATAEALADLLVKDLAKDGASLRGQLPRLLDELVAAGTLMKLDDEYSLQTRESSEWEAEFRNRQTKLVNDPTRMSSKRAQLLGAAVQDSIGSVRLLHGQCKEPRKLALHFGAETPLGTAHEIPVWIRDGWGVDEKNVLADAREAGGPRQPDHPWICPEEPGGRAGTRGCRAKRREGHPGIQGCPYDTGRNRGPTGNGNPTDRSRQQSASTGCRGGRRREGLPRGRQ